VLPALTAVVVEVNDESQVTQRRAQSAARGLAYILEVAGFVDAQAHGAPEDIVGFIVELLACE
jgi:predicted deacylase